MPVSIDKFMVSARGSDITVHVQAHLRILNGNEYSPCALLKERDKISFLISNGVIRSKRNDDKSDGPWRRCSWKRCLHCGIADVSLCPTVAKCVFSTSEISCAFVVTTFLVGHLMEEIARFLLFLRFFRLSMPSQVFFMSFRLLRKNV